MKENFDKSKESLFPSDLPVAFFLAKESIESWKLSPFKNNYWIKMHKDLIKDSSYAEVYEIDADHLLYTTKYKEITEKLNKFLANVPSAS
ncbi:hypothetical protein [Paenibacillus sp. LHD-38]|uniref:hypothetical protein n=1 Tax=Paenibacillus sp. LHD-38 TaxID=3072143 RepID=UPI00280DB577|nr:hypothetical protein [Paenibacillus sp. LHD-38]MDQ8735196.1 hypothetical protein [Paenibacillus sp. LHD-38]